MVEFQTFLLTEDAQKAFFVNFISSDFFFQLTFTITYYRHTSPKFYCKPLKIDKWVSLLLLQDFTA